MRAGDYGRTAGRAGIAAFGGVRISPGPLTQQVDDVTDRDEQMLTLHDVAQLLRVSAKSVTRLMDDDPDFPRPVVVGKSDRWILGELRQWQQLKRFQSRTIVDKPGQIGTSAPTDQKPSSQTGKGR